ncbi:MAG: replication initiation protein, partial [Symploca sp. SIO2E9]|nr:replication initiation protein [Symploca sp. SIO2E9]
ATVVIAVEAMKVKVEGKFRQRERKLFVLLVHAAWNELREKTRHTIRVKDIRNIFREVAGVKSFDDWLWEYLKNLAEVKVIYESKRLKGISRLVASIMVDDEQKTVTYQIPEDLKDVLLTPEQYARLKTHFLIGLKGKYSVALYQVLESKINLNNIKRAGYIDIPLKELKDWLGLGGEYNHWSHFQSRVLTPAVEEININPMATTFTVKVIPLKGKRNKISAIRFFLSKTPERIAQEKQIRLTKRTKQATLTSKLIPPFRCTEIYEKAKKLANGLDVYALEVRWREWVIENDIEVNNSEAHFLSFVETSGKRVQW